MPKPVWQGTTVSDAGDVQSGAQVDVIDEATGLIPAGGIFSDRAGTIPLTNPFFSDSEGFAQFYTAPGEYRITASGVAGTRVWRYNVLPGTAAIADLTTSAIDTIGAVDASEGFFGFGNSSVPTPPVDFDLETLHNGIYNAVAASDPGTYPAGEVAGSIFCYGRASTRRAQMFQSYAVDFPLYKRGYNAGFETWKEILHEGNVNQFEFGGLASGDIIATGNAETATDMLIELDQSLLAVPSAVALSGGNITVTRSGGSVVLAAIASITYAASLSSNKKVFARVTGLSGLTIGEKLQIRSDAAGSLITVTP